MISFFVSHDQTTGKQNKQVKHNTVHVFMGEIALLRF